MKKRKWFIAIVILLIIAAVLTVVFINLFREKDTEQLIDTVHNYVENGYLNKEKHENVRTREYLNLVSDKSINLEEEDKNLISNAITALDAFEIYGALFDRQLIYTKYTEVYRSNRKSIADNLSDAQRYINTLTAYLDKDLDKILESPDVNVKNNWLEQSWKDCEKYVEGITKTSTTAISKLGEVYTSCVKSPLMNNKLTTAIFQATKKQAEKVDLKVANSTKVFKDMATAYLTEEKESIILGVQYNKSLQDKLDIILDEKGEESPEYQQLLAGTLA